MATLHLTLRVTVFLHDKRGGGITISKHPKIYFLNDKDEVRHAMTSADFNLASKKLNLSDLLGTKPVHFNGTSVNSFCTPFSIWGKQCTNFDRHEAKHLKLRFFIFLLSQIL